MQVLQSARLSLTWTAPSLSGIGQKADMPACDRLLRMQECGIHLSHGDKVPLNIFFMAGRAGNTSRALAWVVEGHQDIDVRVWAGEVRETRSLPRLQGQISSGFSILASLFALVNLHLSWWLRTCSGAFMLALFRTLLCFLCAPKLELVRHSEQKTTCVEGRLI